MDTNQIYTLVNTVMEQAFGQQTIQATDTASLVSLGNRVFQSNQDVEIFTNTLTMVIGRTIYSFRTYRNKLADMVLNDFEYGAILQKITAQLAEAQADPAYDLTDGQSVDQWKVTKPKLMQKLFASRTPYMFTVTISRLLLKDAFKSAAAMGSLISMIMGQMRNSIELSFENLGRACMGNFMAELNTTGSTRIVDLLTNYNTQSGETLTAQTAMLDPKFLAYAVKTIHDYSKRFTDMSERFNDKSTVRHTPLEEQRLRIYAPFESALETVVQYDAFHRELVELGVYKELNYWQSNNPGEEMQVQVQRASDNATVTLTNVVAMLHDRDALGIYKREEEVMTTPVNAAGLYYNTFWHERQLWFNDLSEQGVLFVLGPQAAPVPAPTETTKTKGTK